jgi:hypothetical protein
MPSHRRRPRKARTMTPQLGRPTASHPQRSGREGAENLRIPGVMPARSRRHAIAVADSRLGWALTPSGVRPGAPGFAHARPPGARLFLVRVGQRPAAGPRGAAPTVARAGYHRDPHPGRRPGAPPPLGRKCRAHGGGLKPGTIVRQREGRPPPPMRAACPPRLCVRSPSLCTGWRSLARCQSRCANSPTAVVRTSCLQTAQR